jgi:hypothetical protein
MKDAKVQVICPAFRSQLPAGAFVSSRP